MSEVKLPFAAQAYVEKQKIQRYLLNFNHPEGASKAKYFSNRGFDAERWETMVEALSIHAEQNTVVKTVRTPFGTKYTVDCHLPTPDQQNPCIRTIWEIATGTSQPRLVTAHPYRD